MKKFLIGTSALVAAVAVSGAAQAADPIKLSVGGYGAFDIYYADNDEDFLDANGDPEVNEFDVLGDSEIHFAGSTTLDNGIKISAKYEFEAQSQGADTLDEWTIAISGVFGTFSAQSNDSLGEALWIGAPRVGGRLMGAGMEEGMLLTGDVIFVPGADGFTAGGTVAGNMARTTSFINGSDDAESIRYLTPSFAGFTLGVGYTPQADKFFGSPGGGLPNSIESTADEAWEVGAAFEREFSGIGVGFQVSYYTQDTTDGGTCTNVAPGLGAVTTDAALSVVASTRVPGTTVSTDMVGRCWTYEREDAYQLGGAVSYAGFTLGGSWAHRDYDGSAATNRAMVGDADGDAWSIGLAYEFGPYGVSLVYFDSDYDVDDIGGEDERRAIEFVGSYDLGPGVLISAGIGWVEFENGVDLARDRAIIEAVNNDIPGTANDFAAPDASGYENDGIIVATGMTLSF